MAHYVTTIESPWAAEKAFAYMADLRNFEEWDPGVASSKLVLGEEPGLGAAYDVKVSGTELRYETLSYDAPRRTTVEAKSTLLTSFDIIDVTAAADGCQVTYDATLTLNGPLGLLDPLVKLIFNRIGDKARSGMERALDGRAIS